MAALAVAVMAPIGLLIHHGNVGGLKAVLLAAIFAAICGIAYWLSWGGSHVFFRLIIVGLGVVFLCIALGAMVRGHSEYLQFATVTLGTAMVVALPRLAGVIRVRLGPDGLPEASQSSRQFSMLDLFVWTTTAALLAAVVRWADVPNKLPAADELLVWSVRLGICTLLAMWGVLAMGRRVIARLAIGLLVAIAIDALTPMIVGRLKSTDPDERVAIVAAQLMVAAFLYFFRRRGVRLMLSRSVRVVEPNEATNRTDGSTSRQLYAAIGCFALAAAIAGICFILPPSPDIGEITLVCLGFASPAIGGFVGLGIGCLIGRKIWGLVIGFAVPLAWLVGFLMMI